MEGFEELGIGFGTSWILGLYRMIMLAFIIPCQYIVSTKAVFQYSPPMKIEEWSDKPKSRARIASTVS